MIIIYSSLAVILIYFIYFNLQSGKNVKKYGDAKYFLSEIITPLILTYPNNKLVHESKGRLRYEFYDDLFVLSFEFIYQPSKIQVTVRQNSVVKKEMRSSSCMYDISEIKECCNKLVQQIVTGVSN
ncbi:MAG: hypothetical protein KA734_00835 [Fluviicola sp.]|nr:hypothetical protein [Fluviicola sp.]MBP6271346.1 hypothetical protein [Fluviicola sp.]